MGIFFLGWGWCFIFDGYCWLLNSWVVIRLVSFIIKIINVRGGRRKMENFFFRFGCWIVFFKKKLFFKNLIILIFYLIISVIYVYYEKCEKIKIEIIYYFMKIIKGRKIKWEFFIKIWVMMVLCVYLYVCLYKLFMFVCL